MDRKIIGSHDVPDAAPFDLLKKDLRKVVPHIAKAPGSIGVDGCKRVEKGRDHFAVRAKAAHYILTDKVLMKMTVVLVADFLKRLPGDFKPRLEGLIVDLSMFKRGVCR
jgi:hypothetical protein